MTLSLNILKFSYNVQRKLILKPHACVVVIATGYVSLIVIRSIISPGFCFGLPFANILGPLKEQIKSTVGTRCRH